MDWKQTCFGVSLDGEAAFPSVERDIQIRELYTVGERGDFLAYDKGTYENTECHLKQKGMLSRRIREEKGNHQGHVRGNGHFTLDHSLLQQFVLQMLAMLCQTLQLDSKQLLVL